MSEITILSNASSSLLASSYAGQGPDRSEYIYSMDLSTVYKHVSKFVKVPFKNPNFGESQSVEIPSFGVLNRMMLRFELTMHNDAEDTDIYDSLYAKPHSYTQLTLPTSYLL